MRRIGTADFAVLTLLFLASCVGTQEDEETLVGTSLSALEYDNALNPNALNPNALNPNALNPNALGRNALNPEALHPDALRAILDPGEAGALSRELLSYAVGCALTPAQSFSFSWTDLTGLIHQVVYRGILGLAPGWKDGPLSPIDQQWVSACLASRTNWYGIPVTISSRAGHAALDKAGSLELLTYPRLEGAFWGNMFADAPYLHACYLEENVAHARLLLRDCAAGHLDSSGAVQQCGMIRILGSCEAHCLPLNTKGMYYPGCVNNLTGKPDLSTRVITVGLL